MRPDTATRVQHPSFLSMLVVSLLVISCLLALSGCATGSSTDAAAATSDSATTEATTDSATTDSATTDSATAEATTDPAAEPVASRGIVCIDAGHGDKADLTRTPVGPGSSTTQYVEPGGASGVRTGTPEYEVNLDVALKLQTRLEAAGYDVVMVRTTNDVVISSEERADIANQAGADLFIRLHCDGTDDSSSSGFSTLVPGENRWTSGIVASSREAADVMHPIIVDELGCRDAGIVERTDLAGFNFSEVPTVLFEMGFLSNPSEEALLVSDGYQDKLADAICDATDAYFDTRTEG